MPIRARTQLALHQHPTGVDKSPAVALGKPEAEPGLVVCAHPFGSLLNFHPHLHVMATDGGFTPDGIFHPLPAMSLAQIEGLFRHRVFGMLRRKGLLSPERIKLMESWTHPGFNVDATVRINAGARGGSRGRSSRCRPPTRHRRRRLCVPRGRFIKRIFAADPLECPDCGGAMRIVAFVEDRRVVRVILEHVSLRDEPRPPPAAPAAPRAPVELKCLPLAEPRRQAATR